MVIWDFLGDKDEGKLSGHIMTFASEMTDFVEEVVSFLKGNGIHSELSECSSANMVKGEELPIIYTDTVAVIPILVRARSLEEARLESDRLTKVLKTIDKGYVVVCEDLWRSRTALMQGRLLAQFGLSARIFARNTEVVHLNAVESATFMCDNHIYGDAASRFRYGLVDREGRLVAASSFSAPRLWQKPYGQVASYEWTRYASLSSLRVVGGMGKLLAAFVSEVRPDDIMTYADLEWTGGKSYSRLGFEAESLRRPIAFSIDRRTWQRRIYEPADMYHTSVIGEAYIHVNLGSMKYRWGRSALLGKQGDD